jgi:ribosomal protein S8
MIIIKKAYKAEFLQLLSVIRLATLSGRSYVAFSKKKFNYIKILLMLQYNGFIEGFEERGEMLIVKLRQTYFKSMQPPLKSIVTIENIRVGKRGAISAKKLSKLQKLQGQAPLILLTTNLGVISGLQGSACAVGGIPLFKIC